MDDSFSTTRGPAIARSCLEPDFDRVARQPELRLMLAILEDAVVTFHRGLGSSCPKQRKQFAEVGRWIGSRDDDSPVSFENVCAALLLDPDYIRSGLRAIERGTTQNAMPQSGRRIRRGGNDYGPWLPARQRQRPATQQKQKSEGNHGFD